MKIASHNVIIPVELINNSQAKKVVRKNFHLYLFLRFDGKSTIVKQIELPKIWIAVRCMYSQASKKLHNLMQIQYFIFNYGITPLLIAMNPLKHTEKKRKNTAEWNFFAVSHG